MREIKFRAWDIKSKEMFNNVSMLSAYNKTIGGFKMEYGNTICMQYTGLKDKNEKEIYEDDVLQDNVGRLWNVGFDNFKLAFCFYYQGWKNHKTLQTFDDFIESQLPFKIIGNIYENPEFLQT